MLYGPWCSLKSLTSGWFDQPVGKQLINVKDAFGASTLLAVVTFFLIVSFSHADPLSHNFLFSTTSPQTLTNDNPKFSENPPCPLTPDHEELVTMESVEYQQEEVSEEMEKDPLSDSGYIELHYYQSHQYLVLPGDTELDLETVEILQLDAEAQEAAGSLLDLAGGGY